MTGLDTHRHAREAAWPYGQPPWPAARPVSARDSENLRTPSPWYRIGAPDFDDLARVLALGLAAIVTVQFIPTAWRHPEGIVDAPIGAKVAGGHAVLAVGVVDEGNKDCLIFKNSWGTWWGQGGDGFMTREYVENSGVVAHVVGVSSARSLAIDLSMPTTSL